MFSHDSTKKRSSIHADVLKTIFHHLQWKGQLVVQGKAAAFLQPQA